MQLHVLLHSGPLISGGICDLFENLCKESLEPYEGAQIASSNVFELETRFILTQDFASNRYEQRRIRGNFIK